MRITSLAALHKDKVKFHDGYIGMFTRETYEGAWPNGTRVIKQNSDPGDMHEDGALGTVLGSIGHKDVGIFYFVEWDSHPKSAVGIQATRVRLADGTR